VGQGLGLTIITTGSGAMGGPGAVHMEGPQAPAAMDPQGHTATGEGPSWAHQWVSRDLLLQASWQACRMGCGLALGGVLKCNLAYSSAEQRSMGQVWC
jgi:hypothetical protein